MKDTRETWSRKIEFILSCVGYAVGLSNICRFPYLCMTNGGGAFLIPYFIFLFICGIPLVFMEMALGQYSSSSPLAVWEVAPIFKGLGYCMMAVNLISCAYFNMMLAWCLYYLVSSFSDQLPWSSCSNSWNDQYCITGVKNGGSLQQSSNRSSLLTNMSYITANVTGVDVLNVTERAVNATAQSATVNSTKLMTAAEQFWTYRVLDISGGIGELGGIRWQLLLCLLAAWLFIYLCLFKGVKLLGKIVYVTAIVPYILLLALLIRGCLLDGAWDGIMFYIKPEWHRLGEFKIWVDACLQIFMSLGAGWGGLITMSSYNKFHNNCYRDAWLIPLINCGTSFFAGFVVFAIIGNMAHNAGVPVDKIVTSGPGLAFIVYPQALSTLPGAQIWSVLFFLMLVTVALDSQFGCLEGVIASVVDEKWELLHRHRALITLAVVAIEFLIGLFLVTRAGIYIFQIMDWYASPFSVVIVALVECVVVAYVYGANRVYRDVELMLGTKPSLYMKMCWCVVTPLCLVVILIMSALQFSVPTYGTYHYPGWAIGLGWALALASMLPLPAYAVYRVARTPGCSLWQRVLAASRPSSKWGPKNPADRADCKICLPVGLDTKL